MTDPTSACYGSTHLACSTQTLLAKALLTCTDSPNPCSPQLNTPHLPIQTLPDHSSPIRYLLLACKSLPDPVPPSRYAPAIPELSLPFQSNADPSFPRLPDRAPAYLHNPPSPFHDCVALTCQTTLTILYRLRQTRTFLTKSVLACQFLPGQNRPSLACHHLQYRTAPVWTTPSLVVPANPHHAILGRTRTFLSCKCAPCLGTPLLPLPRQNPPGLQILKRSPTCYAAPHPACCSSPCLSLPRLFVPAMIDPCHTSPS